MPYTYYDYEEGVKAKVIQHKANLCDMLRETLNCSDEELVERGYLVEEIGRFLDKLYEDYQDDDTIKVMYSDGLNYFEILEDN